MEHVDPVQFLLTMGFMLSMVLLIAALEANKESVGVFVRDVWLITVALLLAFKQRFFRTNVRAWAAHWADNNVSSYDDEGASSKNESSVVLADTTAEYRGAEPPAEPVPEPDARERRIAILAIMRNDDGSYLFSKNEIVEKAKGNRASTLGLIDRYRGAAAVPSGKHSFSRAELDAT